MQFGVLLVGFAVWIGRGLSLTAQIRHLPPGVSQITGNREGFCISTYPLLAGLMQSQKL